MFFFCECEILSLLGVGLGWIPWRVWFDSCLLTITQVPTLDSGNKIGYTVFSLTKGQKVTIKAQKASPVYAADDYADVSEPRGEVSGFMLIDVPTIFGNTRTRRVSIGRCPASLTEARRMVANVREKETERQIHAEFKVHL